MRKELHVSHIPQPQNQLPFPFQVKKRQKNPKKPKTRTTHAHFFRLPHGLERSKRDIYIFIWTQSSLGCQGDSDDVIESESILLTIIDDVIGQVVMVIVMTS